MLNKHEVIKIAQKLLREDSNANESYNERSDIGIALYLDYIRKAI